MLSYARPFGVYTDFYDALPQSYKDKAVKTLQSWQSEEDGYFYVPWQPKESQTSAKRERDLSNATSLLKKLGGAPLYLLPSERLQQNKAGAAKASSSANALPPQYQSEEAMLAWLNGLSWSSSPYSALHQVSASVNTIKAAGFYQLVCDYISEKQNPATGLWGEGVDHKAVDAALKAGAVYSKEYPMPHLEKIIDNVLKVLEVNEGLENACQIWNPIRVLQYGYEFYDYRLPKEIEDKFRKQLPAIIDLTIANAKKFQQDDGGLSYYMNWTPNKAQGSPNGLGLAEGNTDHTLLGTFLSRNTMTDIANQTIQTPLFTESADKILAVLSSNEPVVKKERAIGTNKDFEDLEPGGKLPWDVVSTCLIGGVTVAEDPYRENNKVLRLESLPGAESGVSIIAQSYDDSKSITLECELLFESLTKGSSAYNEIGDLNGVQWCFTSPDGVSVSLARRNNQAGVGTIMQTGLKMKKWYTLKIVYEPRETDDSQVTYYLDGRIIDRTNQYYNGDKASQLPARRIERVTFHPFQAAQGVIYIDNVKVSAER